MQYKNIIDNLNEACKKDNWAEKRSALFLFLNALESGHIRTAQNKNNQWIVNSDVKQGILHAFTLGQAKTIFAGDFTFIDKDTLLPRKFNIDDQVRLVGGASFVRRGAYIGKNIVIMSPSFINIGAFIDDGSMIDSNVLVGSCAQIGKKVHISAGTQIGGVLEPIGSLPVIIEDNAFIGGNCGIFDGVHIKENAVLGAGVILTQSTIIYDLVNESIITKKDDLPLCVPQNAVIVPGARAINKAFAQNHSLSLYCPIIVKYRDDKTNDKILLEEYLR